MSNTNKELYEWAWDQYNKSGKIDMLIEDMERFLKRWEIIKKGEGVSPTPYGVSECISINRAYVPLLIEALENLK